VNNQNFWKKDWFLGLVIVVSFAALHLTTGVTQGIERWAYDWGLNATSAQSNQQIAVLVIDEKSLETVGRWPWSRHIHAQAIEKLTISGAKVIGHTAFFFEPQEDPGLAIIKNLDEYMLDSGLSKVEIDSSTGQSIIVPGEEFERLSEKATNINKGVRAGLIEDIDFIASSVLVIQNKIDEAKVLLDGDRALSKTISASGKVVLPTFMFLGEAYGKPDFETPRYVQQFSLANTIQKNQQQPLTAYNLQFPIETVAASVAGMGHLNAVLDIDGSARSDALVIDYFGQHYPSMSLMLAAKTLNLDLSEVLITDAPSVKIGKLNIKTDKELKMLTFYYPDVSGAPAFSVNSFSDFYFDVIPADQFKGKTVLIGATAAGLGTTLVTPISSAMPPVLVLAHNLSSILQEDFFTSPGWTLWIVVFSFVFVGLFLTALLPRLNAQYGALISLAIIALCLGAHFLLMTTQRLWIPLMTPIVMLIIGYLLLTTKRFFVSEKGKESADLESAESNRMLGLAFQGQGQLDMAFEKFRKCPKDEQLAEALFNLALDFERKRQFSKSGNVYSYIFDFAPKFKDVADRLERSKKMEETMIIGSGSGLGPSLMISGDGVEKPKLGRYEIIKELGKGAMGMVYLGNDPKISREVAIKTMALSQEFEGDALQDAKDRFFREAETAGRLSHPNIVVILDAGEEHDLAYIAMEFLKGRDLSDHIKPDKLLAPATVFDIILKCASGLDYAHSLNVVHRDIKPANIMYEPNTKEVKITDFGIARITDSNKTKTGTILGTPSYMSPEQLSGKHVDGRSDLFSLVVMAFQMLCGELPFQGDSMAALMFQIANEPHPKIRSINPKLPQELEDFFDKGLSKDPDKRFKTGKELSNGLKTCLIAAKRRHEKNSAS
jgi:eukaryotic-like serine/threonine-protein kinase